MTQRPIVTHLSLKRMSVHEIHNDIVATLVSDAVSSSSVPCYLPEARFPISKPELSLADAQRDLDDSDHAILTRLEDIPFASVWQLSRLIHLPSTTTCHSLTKSLGFVVRQLRWVPYALSDVQKVKRVNLSRQLLRMLVVQGDRAWHDIVTLDESWFHLSPDSEFVWRT
jgi:hypothetical protein